MRHGTAISRRSGDRRGCSSAKVTRRLFCRSYVTTPIHRRRKLADDKWGHCSVYTSRDHADTIVRCDARASSASTYHFRLPSWIYADRRSTRNLFRRARCAENFLLLRPHKKEEKKKENVMRRNAPAPFKGWPMSMPFPRRIQCLVRL